MKLLDQEIKETYSVLAEGYDCIQEAENIVESHEEQLLDRISFSVCRLAKIVETHSKPNWNGNDALPVSKVSYMSAFKFLIGLPEGVEIPSPGVCPNGQLTLEWRKSDGRLLSLAFDEKGFVSYIVFLSDGERVWGVNRVLLGYSDLLIGFLQQVLK